MLDDKDKLKIAEEEYKKYFEDDSPLHLNIDGSPNLEYFEETNDQESESENS